MSATGQCLCGAVKITVEGDALGARTCWCRTCQKFSGGNGTTNAFFRDEAVTTDGKLSWYENVADSGNITRRAFCAECGSHVFTMGSGAPGFRGVRVSMFDDSNAFPPQAVIWTDSAPRWAALDSALPHFPKAPPPPPQQNR